MGIGLIRPTCVGLIRPIRISLIRPAGIGWDRSACWIIRTDDQFPPDPLTRQSVCRTIDDKPPIAVKVHPVATDGTTVVHQIVRNAPLIDQGKGTPTLVFLHYFGGAASSWQWVIQSLQAEFRCVALDLPGFGQQPPLEEPSLHAYSRFIWQTLAELGVDQFILVGHSMGGKIALQMATESVLAEPHQVVLVAPSPPTQEPMPDAERERLLNHFADPDQARQTIDQATIKVLSETQRAIATQTHILIAESACRWWLLEGMNHGIVEHLSHLRAPVTVLASTTDPVIPLDTMQSEVMGKLPQATLVKVSEIGHLLPLEAPELVAEAIRQVARSGEPR